MFEKFPRTFGEHCANSVAVQTSYWLRTTGFILQPWKSEPLQEYHSAEIEMWEPGTLLSKYLRGEFISLWLPAFGSCLSSLSQGHFLHLQNQHEWVESSSRRSPASLCVCLLPCVSIVDSIRSMGITKHSLFPWGHLISDLN